VVQVAAFQPHTDKGCSPRFSRTYTPAPPTQIIAAERAAEVAAQKEQQAQAASEQASQALAQSQGEVESLRK